MSRVNINEFMDLFHAAERDLGLFDDRVDGAPWWDIVRYDVCYFLFDRLTGLTYSSTPQPRKRALGTLRRWALRQRLFGQALLRPRDLLAIRAPRSTAGGQRHDVVLDPILHALDAPFRAVDTVPRRYHLPEFDARRWPGTVPASLPDIIAALLKTFAIDDCHAAALEARIRALRGEHESQVAAYHRLLAITRPKAILLVQNGLEKALFHVARTRGVPTVEVQHGLIGHGHPAYSYPRGIDYSAQTTLPDLFLTFSAFWQTSIHYPVQRMEVVGTDHFADGFAALDRPFGTVMIISANIYHDELLAVTREVASRLPHRKFIYKLHPNQRSDDPAIRVALSDLPNVEVGDAQTPASRMMGDVSHIVAIQSTVVYEALQTGRRVCILPRHDYHIHADIFGLDSVAVPETEQALVAALEIPGLSTRGQTFFEAFDPQRARTILRPLLYPAGDTRAIS